MKIGFCFLVYDTVRHPGVWKEFFENGDDDDFEIISHIKKPNEKTPRWLQSARVKSTKTRHCGFGLVAAHLQMIRKCLLLKCTHCVLLSQDCIPLWYKDDILKKIKHVERSMFAGTHSEDFEDAMSDVGGISYMTSQWCILTRDGMVNYLKIEDTESGKQWRLQMDKKLSNFYKTEKLQRCPDEQYPASFLHHIYGESEFANHVEIPGPVTYVHWYDSNDMSPTPMTIPVARKIRRKLMRVNEEWLFVRKAYKSAVPILAFASSKARKKDDSHK